MLQIYYHYYNNYYEKVTTSPVAVAGYQCGVYSAICTVHKYYSW